MAAKAKKAQDPRGLKRICMECGTRFYDMNNRPIICPSCGAEFTGEVKVKTRRGRAAAVEEAAGQVEEKTAAEATSEDDEEEEEAGDAEIVSLDDLETTEASEDDSDGSVSLAEDDDDLDEIEVDDDLGELDELEPDAEIEEEDGEAEKE